MSNSPLTADHALVPLPVIAPAGAPSFAYFGGWRTFAAGVHNYGSGCPSFASVGKLGTTDLNRWPPVPHFTGQAFKVLGGKTIPQKVWARSSCSTNSIAYVETPSAAANCATTRAEIWVPCLLFTETTEPTRSSRLSRTAAPCLFNFVALAGIVKEHFCRSSPDNPIEAWSAMRLLRRFATWLRPAVALAARFGRCDLGGCAGFRFILIATLECARGRCNVPFVTSPGYPVELLDSSN